MIVGDNSSATDSKALDLTLTGITTSGTGTLNIINSNSDQSKGTRLTLTNLTMSAGGTVTVSQGVGSTENGWNKLIVTDLTADGTAAATIDVKGNALLQVTDHATLGGVNAVAVSLGSDNSTGQANFQKGLEMTNGLITAQKGGAKLAVGTAGLSILQGNLKANGTLDILTVINGTALAKVQLGATGGGSTVGVDVDAGGAINMGAATTYGTVNITGDAGGKLNLEELEINGAVNDSADVATTVTGVTTIKNGGTYETAGINNKYIGGIVAESGGLLTSRNNATIAVGSSGQGTVELAGGSLAAGNGSVFTVEAGQISMTQTGASLDARLGELDLSAAVINVDMPGAGDHAAILTGEDITAKGFKLASGTVAASGGGKFKVADRAQIGGGTAAAVYEVSDATTNFQGGVTVGQNGVISTTTGGGSITVGTTVGTGSKAGNVILAGGATLDGSAGVLGLYDANAVPPTSNRPVSKVVVNGSGNKIIGDVDAQMDMEVTSAMGTSGPALWVYGGADGLSVNSLTVNGGKVAIGNGTTGQISSRGNVTVGNGGSLATTQSGGKVTSLDTTRSNRFLIAKGGSLSSESGDMSIAGFKSVDISGEFLAGWTGTRATLLEADSDVNISSSASVGVTGELAMNASVGDVLIRIASGATANINNRATLSDLSMFGLLGFKVSDDKQRLEISSVSGQIKGDYTDEDLDLAIRNLRSVWGERQIGRDLGTIIYYASVENSAGEYGIIADPADSIPGTKNIDMLQALASPRGKSVGLDTLEYINGAQYYGVSDVAISASSSFMSDLSLRSKAMGRQLAAAREAVGSDEAVASQIMSGNHCSRVWIGGFGAWNDVDSYQGFSGYKYDSTGFIMGYDGVVAENVVAGASFAYANGDYKDKGAISNDSEIATYSFGLYGTYSHPSGVFVSGSAGLTVADNKIDALRHDPSVSGASRATADFNTLVYAVGLNVGYDYRPSECLTISPSIGVNYYYADLRDHSDHLGGVATQRVHGLKNDSFTLPVEITAHHDWRMGEFCSLRLEGTIGYTYNMDVDAMDGTIDYNGIVWNDGSFGGVSSKVASREGDRHTYRIGAGVRYGYKKFDVGFKYDYMMSRKKDTHRLVATAGVAF